MRAPWRRAAAIALATCGLTALPFVVGGCKTDVEAADTKVSTDNDKAVDALVSFHPEAAREAADSATNSKGASLDQQIEANLLAGQADLNAASLLMSGPGTTDASVAAFKAVLDGKAQSGTQTFTEQDRAELLGIDQRQVRVGELLSEISAIARQMVANNSRVIGYKALEPTAARDALQKATSSAQKGENGAWVAGNAPVPSLEGLKAHEQDLQKKIADLTAQRDDLNNKRAQSLQEAGKFSQQADASSGKDSVGFFTQAANQRKEAADDEVKAGELDAQIAPLQQDLAMAQAQEKTINDAIASYGEQSQQVESNWKNVQQRIDEATSLTKSLLEGNGAAASAAPAAAPAPANTAGGATPTPAVSLPQTPNSLAALASELDNQTKALQDLRAKAVTLLSSAMKHYDQAATAAATLTKNLTVLNGDAGNAKLPDRRAWQERMSIYSPANIKLAQAVVQNQFARLYTDHYAEIVQRNAVATLVNDAMKGSGMTAPQSLAAALPPVGTVPVDVDTKLKEYQGDLKSDQPPFQKDQSDLNELAAGQSSPAGLQAITAAQADFAFKWAQSLINDVISAPGSGESATLTTNIAHAALMSTEYGNAQFDLLAGRQQESAAMMKAALSERGTLVDANAQNVIPGQLPPGLAFEPKPATPAIAPTTSPAPSSASTGAPAASPDQQEVLKVVVEYLNDVADAQPDKAEALCVADPRVSPSLHAMTDFIATIDPYANALHAKFGDAANTLIAAMNAMKANLRPDPSSLKVTINGSKATISSPQDPQFMGLLKTDSGWKISPPSDKDVQMLGPIRALGGLLKQETLDIQAGKFATLQDMLNDLQSKAAAAGVPLPGLNGTPPTTAPAPETTPAPAGATPAAPPTPGTTPPAEGTTPAPTTPGTTPPAPTPGTTPPAGGAAPTPAPGTSAPAPGK